jgi:hypothetical protein
LHAFCNACVDFVRCAAGMEICNRKSLHFIYEVTQHSQAKSKYYHGRAVCIIQWRGQWHFMIFGKIWYPWIVVRTNRTGSKTQNKW